VRLGTGLSGLVVAGVLAGCGTLPPLRRQADVGRDAYAVFVADGPDGRGDLFAVRGDGGRLIQVTFTPVAEAAPALSPDGVLVAFLRGRGAADTLPRDLWVLNLLSGAEREVTLPADVRPSRVAWSPDARTLYLETSRGRWRAAAPPARPEPGPVPPAESARADSALAVVLGEPAFARVEACGAGQRGICARTADGTTTVDSLGHSAARWGGDSVGYFIGDALVVRPLGPGRTRGINFERHTPRRPRSLTYFAGVTHP